MNSVEVTEPRTDNEVSNKNTDLTIHRESRSRERTLIKDKILVKSCQIVSIILLIIKI